MTTPGSLVPDPVDQQHIMDIVISVPDLNPFDLIGIYAPGKQFPADLRMPTPAAGKAALAALSKVGYDVTRTMDVTSRGRELTVHGWSTDLLQARLPAMHAVIESLSSDLGATATAVLDRLSELPVTSLPGTEDQQAIAFRAMRELDTWIGGESGVQEHLNPEALPVDPDVAELVRTTQTTEDLITAVADRHLEITQDALAIYPELRKTLNHDEARDTAIQQASDRPSSLDGLRVPQVTQSQLGESGPEHGPAQSSDARPWSQRGADPTQIFPADATPGESAALPPSASHPPKRYTPGGTRP